MEEPLEAIKGATLCGLAVAAGFLDCDPIRNDPRNAGKPFLSRDHLLAGEKVFIPDIDPREVDKETEKEHLFQALNAPPVLIRFVHGSRTTPYRQDVESEVLHVSNFPTNKAGNNPKLSFPSGTSFDDRGHEDFDTFKVEVVDSAGPATVKVTLQALRPVFLPDGTIGSHQEFAAADKPDRTLTVTAERVPSKVCYRSAYLRLVVDKVDQKAAAAQALLVTDTSDGNQGDPDKLEILDQKVEAAYTRTKCNGTPKCTVRTAAPVGDTPRKRVKVSVHVLKDATGKKVAEFVDVRRNVLANVRQMYAQADASVRILEPIRDVPLPANMLAVADVKGALAIGNKTITVRVQVDALDQTVSITTTANDRPIATAVTLAAAIQAVLPAGVTATASENSPLVGQTIGSADVIVGNPLAQTITLRVTASGDLQHPVRVGSLSSTTVLEFDNTNAHVGTIEERVLVKNFDTGDDRVDMFIVGALNTGSFGEAFIPNAAKAANLRTATRMINSVLIFADTVNKKEFFYTTMPHEMGHVLMDANHALTITEIMVQNRGDLNPQSNERVVNGPKRISDPVVVTYDDGVKGVPVNLLRTRNAGLLEEF